MHRAVRTPAASMVRGLQERAARAFPAEQIEIVDGWWLRHSPGCAWWVGTVLPHTDAEPAELVRRIVVAEKFYSERGAVARFQISPGACPDGLVPALARRGYRRERLVSLQVASARALADVARPAPTARGPATALRVALDDRPTPAWFETWHAVHGGDGQAEWQLLTRVRQPSAFACVSAGDEVVAVGRAVADTGWAGVFGMATVAQARGRGAARAVLAALARWACAHHADRIYLQVERDNSPALRLYERAGCAEICAYHYATAA